MRTHGTTFSLGIHCSRNEILLVEVALFFLEVLAARPRALPEAFVFGARCFLDRLRVFWVFVLLRLDESFFFTRC